MLQCADIFNSKRNKNMQPIFFIIPFMVMVFFAMVAIFKWLWNITMPQVFELRMITYWQAFRILIISGLLFGSTKFLNFNFQM